HNDDGSGEGRAATKGDGMETLRRDDPRERSSCRRLFDIKPGMTFNFLTTVEYLPGTKDRKQYWLCKCVCGKLVYATPTALRKDRAVSCGCCTRRRKKKVRMTPERRRQLQKLAAIPGPTPLEIEYGY
ncbi:MAG: hypothetical protein WC340_16875, partial [Kiritimatiellia bacterium]